MKCLEGIQRQADSTHRHTRRHTYTVAHWKMQIEAIWIFCSLILWLRLCLASCVSFPLSSFYSLLSFPLSLSSSLALYLSLLLSCSFPFILTDLAKICAQKSTQWQLFFLPTHCNWAIGKAFDARQHRKLNEKPTSFHVVSVSFAQTRLAAESLQSCSWHKSNLFFHFASRQRQQRKVARHGCGGEKEGEILCVC